MVCQVEGLDGTIKGRGTVIGCTGGVGQGMGVDCWDQAVLISDIGCKFSILGMLVMSAHLPATTMVVAALLQGVKWGSLTLDKSQERLHGSVSQ